MRPRRVAAGFTLIELVVVITIAAIIAVFMVFFLTTPVESYFAQTRRAALVDSASLILRNISSDVRTALPNSIRWTPVAGGGALELLATNGVARYYGPNDKLYIGGAQEQAEELSYGVADPSFYTMGLFTPASAGSYLAIDNQWPPLAYTSGAGVMNPAPAISIVAGTENRVQFAAPGAIFANASPTHSAFVVSGPVSYLCDATAQTLTRYAGYTPTAAQPTTAALLAGATTTSLIAQNVSACTATVVLAPASGKFNQLVILNVTLVSSAGTAPSGAETLQVFYEVPAEYLP